MSLSRFCRRGNAHELRQPSVIGISIGESKQKEKEVLIYGNKTRISGTRKMVENGSDTISATNAARRP